MLSFSMRSRVLGNVLKRSLAAILKSAEARQLSAASVLEHRLLGGSKSETRH